MRMRARLSATRILALLGALATAEPRSVSGDTGASSGGAPFVIAYGAEPTAAEQLAVRELDEYLGKVTGADVQVVGEPDVPASGRVIYVGWTEYAARHGLDVAALGEEEWVLRSVGEHLMLAGGRPRGTLYAVYEFLETQLGCLWLDRYGDEVIPQRPLPAFGKLNARGKPHFTGRAAYDLDEIRENVEAHLRFLVRNKASAGGEPYGYGILATGCGSPRGSHTFSHYVNASDWFASHPEYFSLVDGQRLPATSAVGPGQLCMTHPAVRRLVLERLREFIRHDRDVAMSKGRPAPRVYDISQTDAPAAECECDGCRAITNREGSESGPLIDFINAIADGIREEYPDVLIMTFAYNRTQSPPRTLKPRDNVMIRWCDVYSTSDLLRPLTHEFNRRNADQLRGWGRLARQVWVWDYWLPFGSARFPAPYTIVQCLPPDLRLFADSRVTVMFTQARETAAAGENFCALRNWLAYKLMQNPYQPAAPLIRTFMEAYYGAAAPRMQEYLDYLQGRIDREAEFMQHRNDRYGLKYLDPEFFVMSEKLFDAAEALCAPGGREWLHVRHERKAVDLCLLLYWNDLERKLPAGRALPFDRAVVLDRYEAAVNSQSDTFYPERGQDQGGMIAALRDPRLPAAFRNLPPRDIADSPWFTWMPYTVSPGRIVPDPRAVGGRAAIFAAEASFSMGIKNGPAVQFDPAQWPRDGKYGLHKLGTFAVTKGMRVWAGADDQAGISVDRVYDPLAGDNTWDFYASLKVSGPAWVPGSTEENGLYLERVLLVKPR